MHKKSEKCEASRNYEKFFFVGRKKKQKRERRERGEGGKNSKERRREQNSKAGPYDTVRCNVVFKTFVF